MAALAVALPALAAAIRALIQRWYPTLDDGIYSARAWDVGTTNNPMLATWSSRSSATGILMNHPGPMPYQLLAPFRRLMGPMGVRAGSAAINGGALATVAWLGWRVGRRRGVVAFGGGGLVLAASMGSEVLTDPWTHNLPLLACFAASVALWASLAGDRWGPLAAAFWASLCAQTSLAYVVLAAVLVAGSLSAAAAWWWAARRNPLDPADAGRPSAAARLRALAGAVVVLAALWALPAWEQFVAPDGPPGNVTAMIENAERLGDGRGVGFGVQAYSDVVLIPPAWVFPEPLTWENNAGARWGVGASSVVFGGFLLVLAAATWWAARRRSTALLAAVGSTGILTLASVATLANISETTLATAAYLRWLFPVGAFVTSALTLVALDAVLTLVPGTERLPRLARSGAGAATALALVVGLTAYSVDTHGLESGSPRWANEPASQLHRALEAAPETLADRGPVVAVETPYFTSLVLFPAVLDELLAAGADVRFPPGSPLLTQFGVARAATGDEAWELSTRSGVAAGSVADETGVEVLAEIGTSNPDDFDDLAAAGDALAARIDDSTFVAVPGTARTNTGAFFDQATIRSVLDNPVGSLYDGSAVGLIQRGAVAVPPDLAADIGAFAARVDRRDHAFAVVLQPPGYEPPGRQGPVLNLPGGVNDRNQAETNPTGGP